MLRWVDKFSISASGWAACPCQSVVDLGIIFLASLTKKFHRGIKYCLFLGDSQMPVSCFCGKKPPNLVLFQSDIYLNCKSLKM